MKRTFTQLTLVVIAVVGFSMSSFAQATDLFISEYSEPAGGNHKYIEIFNGTGDSVNLANYEVWKIGNGGSWPEDTLQLSGWLHDQDVYVIANNQSDASILAAADTVFSGQIVYFNGDDAMGLAKNISGTLTLIDAVGTWGPDPGSGWDVAGTTNGTKDHTLIRKSSVCSPDTNWTTVTAGTTVANSQWIVMAANSWSDVGMHTNLCAAPVSNDTIKPEVTDGVFASTTSVTVVFSEEVTTATAQNVNNYVFTPALTVSSAVLSASEDSVTLTIGAPGFMTGVLYNVVISNVVDTSANANMMDPFNTDFYYNSYTGTDLMITEISHSQPSNGVQDIDYFELYNSGSSAVSLAGMEMTSGVNFNIDSNVTLAAGAYLVFVENIDSFNVAFPSITNVIEYDGGSLSGGGETITLSNTIGDAVASVSYGTSAPWPTYSNSEAIEVCDVTTDYTDPANWFYSGNLASTVAADLYGTPGMVSACAAPPVIYTYSIAVLRTVDADGIPDSVGVYCSIEGIVHGKDLDGNAGLSFTVIDDTRGINVFNFNDVDAYVVNEGDEIRVVGTVDFYNGLTEFVADSIQVLSTGNCIPFPTIVTAFSESTESEYIELKNVVLADPSQWPSAGSNANLDLVTMSGDTLTMRLDKDTYIADTIMNGPSGMFNIIGIGGQFDGSAPYDEGYQIFPMFVRDIDSTDYAAPADVVVNEIAVMNASTHADGAGNFHQWIEIYNGSGANVDLTGYFFSNDSTNKYMNRLPRCNNNLTMPAVSFEMFYADVDPILMDERHMLFTMTTANPFIGLYTANGTLVHALEGFSTDLDTEAYTYGLKNNSIADGEVTFTAGTPAASNTAGTILSVISANPENALNVYPNPVSNGNVNFNKEVSFTIYSITGQVILTKENVNSMDVSNLNNGVYIIETTEGEVVRMIVK